MNTDRHLGIWTGLIAAPAFGIAMMVAPDYLHASRNLSGWLFWGGLAAFFDSTIVIFVLSRRAKGGKKMLSWPVMLMIVGVALFCAGAAGYFRKDSAEVAEALPPQQQESSVVDPDISFQKFSLFWVEVEKEKFQLGIVAKLFNTENKSYLLEGMTFQRVAWAMHPRGGYYIRRYAEFPDQFEIMEDNFIKGNDVGYYKKLLPIFIEATIVGGSLPDFVFIGHWNLLIKKRSFLINPLYYTCFEDAISVEQWNSLLKPKSNINIENLNYSKLPESVN